MTNNRSQLTSLFYQHVVMSAGRFLKNQGSNLVLYLESVESKEMNLMLDYIYQDPEEEENNLIQDRNTYSLIMQYRKIMSRHLSGLSYECPICGKSFKSSNACNIHTSRSHQLK